MNLNAWLNNMKLSVTIQHADNYLVINRWSQNGLLVILIVYFQVLPFKSGVSLPNKSPMTRNKGAEIESIK